MTRPSTEGLGRRVCGSLKQRGLAGTVRVAAGDLRYWGFVIGPRYVRESVFDAVHRVNTRGMAKPASEHEFALGYQASPWGPFRAVLESLDLRYEEFTFIDIGCGKGRTLLLASEFRFKRVIGVELSEELAAVARRNAQRYRGGVGRSPIEVLALDGGLYDFPPEPSVALVLGTQGTPTVRRFARVRPHGNRRQACDLRSASSAGRRHSFRCGGVSQASRTASQGLVQTDVAGRDGSARRSIHSTNRDCG